MKQRKYFFFATLIFTIVALFHLLRSLYEWELIISGVSIPVWASWVAVIIAGAMAVRGFWFAEN